MRIFTSWSQSVTRQCVRYCTGLAIAMLMLVGLTANAAAAEESVSSEWQYDFEVYFWLPNIYVTTASQDHITLTLGDLISNLKWLTMVDFGARKDKWSFGADAIYLKIGDHVEETTGGPFGRPETLDVNVSLKGFISTLHAGYQIAGNDKYQLDVIAGARYLDLKLAAIMNDLTGFRKHMKKLPWRTVMGFRNTYKLEIEKSEILGASKMSDRDLMQTQTAQKRAGAKTVRKVDYKKQELYDLWKLYYHKILNNDGTDLNKIVQALDHVDAEMGVKMQKIEFGDVAVVLDMSHSMRGSDERCNLRFLPRLILKF